MTALMEQLRTVANAMNKLQVPWALVGGLAVSIYGTPRTTRDVDIAVALDSSDDVQVLVERLLQVGFSDQQLIMHVAPTRKLGVRLKIPARTTPVPLDLLYCSSGIEKEVVAAALPVEVFPELFVPVASLAHLLAMKIVSENESDRLQDILDIQGLLKEAQDSDIEQAIEAMRLIEQRGFHRDKNLLARLHELRERFGIN